MNDYVEVRLDLAPCDEVATDLIAALLCDCGYESFVPDEKGLLAYIKREDFDTAALQGVISDFPMSASISHRWQLVEGQDWNKEWEKNYFKPIVIDDRCVVHSSFHTDVPQVQHEIVIDPKMAFGTGHHQTTSLVLRRLLDMPLMGKSLIDMGTGTGILAILAAMRGAAPVTAIEIDPWAHANAQENVVTNHHGEITVILGDASALDNVAAADVLVANINRNIILADMGSYANALLPGGTMLLSGFYEHDIPMLAEKADELGLAVGGHTTRDDWACLTLTKPCADA